MGPKQHPAVFPLASDFDSKRKPLERFQTDFNMAANYNLSQVIGKGSFGEVLLAKHLISGEIRAIKKIKKCKYSKENEQDKIFNEI